MKKTLYTFLITIVPLINSAQNNTIMPLGDNEKESRNKISCDLEFIAPSFSYERQISKKVSLGITASPVGLAIVASAFKLRVFDDELLVVENQKFGFLLSYEINKSWYYQFSPQYVGFLDSSSDGFFTASQTGFGFKNGVFKKWGKVELGINVFVGRAGRTFFQDWAIYNSFLILKLPIKKW